MQKLYSIEFLRIIFTFFVIFGHCLERYPQIRKSVKEICNSNHPLFNRTDFAVKCFFIIGGFFLYYAIQKETTVFDYVKKLYNRLAPCLYVLFFLCIFFSIVNISQFPSIIALLPGLHLPARVTGWGDWYVGVYFWVMIFYYALFKNNPKGAFLITLITMYFALHIQFHAQYNGFGTDYFTIIGSEVVVGVHSIGIGLIVAFLAEHMEIKKNSYTLSFFTFLEMITLLTIVFYVVRGEKFNLLQMEIIFGLLLFSIVQSAGILSRVLNSISKVQYLSRYTYQIFLMHIFPLLLLRSHDNFGLSDITCVFIILFGAIVLGIMEYHLIEKKFLPFIKTRFSKEVDV